MIDQFEGGAGWRHVGETGWIREDGIWTLTVWRRRAGWVWRCRNKYPAADRQHRNREGQCASAEEARAAADAALARFHAQEVRR